MPFLLNVSLFQILLHLFTMLIHEFLKMSITFKNIASHHLFDLSMDIHFYLSKFSLVEINPTAHLCFFFTCRNVNIDFSTIFYDVIFTWQQLLQVILKELFIMFFVYFVIAFIFTLNFVLFEIFIIIFYSPVCLIVWVTVRLGAICYFAYVLHSMWSNMSHMFPTAIVVTWML